MQELLRFLEKNRVFLVFCVLEIICFRLIVARNNYQRSAWLSTSNRVAGELVETSNSVNAFFRLGEVNSQLMQENDSLYRSLTRLSAGLEEYRSKDTSRINFRERYEFIPAKVIGNSHLLTDNHLTLDKGIADGIEPGDGLITTSGVVGKVKHCSQHFSTASSVLHSTTYISSQIKKNKHWCFTAWQAGDYTSAVLRDVARHVAIEVGDTVVTSEGEGIYPPGILIGTVSEIGENPTGAFQDIKLRLSVDFARLDYVYVIKNILKNERDSLENLVSKP